MTSQDRTGNDDDVTGAGAGAVRQLRLVVAADDFDEAVAFYRDVLGMPEEAAYQGEGDARVVILHAGRATLEIADPAQKRMIDDVEVGRQVAPALRVALEVDDATATTRALVAGGAEELAPPTVTPWRSLNSRLRAPAGLQVTLFEELDPPAGRTVRPDPDRRPASPLDRVPWPVRTERLSLRAATADDAAATWRFRRLEPVGRWITRAPTTFEEHRDAFRDPDRLATTVVVERDGEVVGDLMLKVEDAWAQAEVAERARGVQAELGWTLDPARAGQGYATEAVRELVRLCFVELGLRRVTASCFADNVASWRLMERLGMRRETHTVRESLHRSGEWLDGLGYALLAEEWRAADGRLSGGG